MAAPSPFASAGTAQKILYTVKRPSLRIEPKLKRRRAERPTPTVQVVVKGPWVKVASNSPITKPPSIEDEFSMFYDESLDLADSSFDFAHETMLDD
nr:hypothetical protein GCM10020093_084470 [Planobispora longispora]